MAGGDPRWQAETPTMMAGQDCPVCDYPLRGLGARTMECPECGMRLDPSRIEVGWRQQSWYGTPEFLSLVKPAGSLVLGVALLTVFCPLLLILGAPVGWVVLAAIGGLLSGVWIVMMIRVWRRFRAIWAIAAASSLHFVYTVYFVVVIPGPVLMVVAILGMGWELIEVWPALLVIALAVVSLVALARWWERLIGRRCLRLRQQRIARVE